MAIRTNKAIIETFEEMLDEMPFEKITVSELAKRCEISPNTFYYHYEDIYDLLQKWFEINREKWLSNSDWRQSFKDFLDYCKTNQKKIYHIYNSLSRDYLERMVFKYEKELITNYFDSIGMRNAVNQEKFDEYIDFVLFGLAGTFLKFIFNDMKEDTAEVVKSVGDLIDGYIAYSINNL